MIDVKQAVQIALQYCAQLFGNQNQLRLEEVELSEDEKHWLITVGFDEPVPSRTDALGQALQGFMPKQYERKYKVVDVDAENGKVKAVKIRHPLERVS
jgi:hypothetical protein